MYEEIEQPLVDVLKRMEEDGVLIDREMLKRQSGELSKRMREIEVEAHREAGAPFNLESPRQLQEILFNKLQLPAMRKTPTGQPSTAEDVLEELAQSYALPRLIMEYRGFAKLKSTYTDKLPLQIDPRTGRVHFLPPGGRRNGTAVIDRSESADILIHLGRSWNSMRHR